MSNVFAGMEALDKKKNEEVSNNQIDLSEVLFDVIEDESAISEMNAEIESMRIAEERFDISFEQLKALHRSIDEFGISKGVILAVDPDGYLEKNGLIPSYESLNDLPTKDENAEIALEGIGDKIKEYWNKIVKAMSALWDKIKAMFTRIFQMFQSYEKVLNKLKENLKDKEFDDDKVKEKKFKTITANNFENAVRYFNDKFVNLFDKISQKVETMVSSIEDENLEDYKKEMSELYSAVVNENDDNESILGMKAEMDNDKPTWKSSGKSIFDNAKEDTLTNLGYSKVDVIIDKIDSAISVLKSSGNIEKQVKVADKTNSEFEKAVKKLISEAKSNKDEDKVKELDKKLKIARTYINFNRISYTKMSNIVIKIAKTAIALGNAAKSVSKSK